MVRVVLGTSISGRGGETGTREAAAQRALASLTDTVALNFAFPGETPPALVATRAVLPRDASAVARAPGPRKPIVTDILDLAAEEAARRGAPFCGIVNGDIVVSQAAIDTLADPPAPALAYFRLDVGGGETPEMLLFGVDMFVFSVPWWRAERRRFRDYILGEAIWDNVFAAIAACHGGVLLHADPFITHERHAGGGSSAYARYLQSLAARDATYFSRWCAFVEGVREAREQGGGAEAERAVAAAAFRPPTRRERALDVLRGLRWRA